ncbi:hypothetical protein H072_2475 [Dactylellina haptotyla CBS 200.50]|uniref:Mannose-1-phosphate guanyltransferase n=1 Tax=Dactylellina haptotyla (strain CBS 200.50) TaxID=1284197 RepID=S8AKR4_DACHA|nr:hypothetical protein H072_2475 [Dactylellina haptotyla CBS 200.50]
MPSAHSALGLTAVILCGEGSDLKPIISTQKLPKALLPIANKPMLQYPLEWVLDAGLTSIVIVCIEGQETAIKSFVKEVYANRESQTPASKNSRPLLQPTIVGAVLPNSKTGTAEVLRLPQVHSLIKNDFMVLSCDSICEIPAATVIKEWMLLPDTLGNKSGALGVWYEVQKQKGAERDLLLTGPISRFDLEASLRSTEARTDETAEVSYLLQNYGSRKEDFKDDIRIRRALFRRHPKLLLNDAYRDAHIYIFPFWSLKFILANPSNKLKSIKDDVLSWWAKACWQGSGKQAHLLGMLKILNDEDDDNDSQKSDGLSMTSFREEEITEKTIENFLGMSTTRTSTWSASDDAAKGRKQINTRGWFPTEETEASPVDSPTPSSTDSREKEFKKIRIPAYNGLFVPGIAVFKPQMTITPLATTPLIRRVDTLPLYLSTCLELARNPVYNAKAVHQTAEVHERANVSNIDSMVGAGSKIEEKVLIKRSVVGKNVKIGKMAKVQGCVILDGAEIGAGCKLEGCIIGRFTKIGANSALTACQVVEEVVLRDRTVEKDKLITQSSAEESEEEEDDIFGRDGGPSGDGGDDDDDDSEEDDDDDDDDDDSEDDDDNTTTKSVPTTTKESVTPITSLTTNLTPHHKEKAVAFKVPEAKNVEPDIELDPKETLPASITETMKETAETVETTEEAGDVDAETEAGPEVPFVELELQGEEDEEDEEDEFEPDSDDSSFCEEEYDSGFQTDDEIASGDDTGNLSGPEEDGGPLKSPKRMSRSFAEDMSKSMAQMASMNLAAVMGGTDTVDESVKQAMKESLPDAVQVPQVPIGVEILPDVRPGDKGN